MRAAIFDLDGTLVDNMGAHADAWIALCARLGTPLPRERFLREFAGRKNDEIVPVLLPAADPARVAEVAEEKEALYREAYRAQMAPLPGLVALLESLRAAGTRLAVASAAPEANRALVLDGLRLRAWFAEVVGPEHAKRGKPHPDLFLAAAAKLGVAPPSCVAFEDAVLGVQSARAAGMEVVALTTSQPAEVLRGAGARWTVPDYRALPADLAAQLGV